MGVILNHSIPKNTNVTGDEYYEDIIKDYLLLTIAKVRPKLTDKIILHHNIVALNEAISLRDKVEMITVPPDSPDLFPGDFWFNRDMKIILEQKECLSIISDFKSAIQNWLNETHLKKTFKFNYNVLIKHWEQCVFTERV